MMMPKVGRAGEVLATPRPALAETPDVTYGVALGAVIAAFPRPVTSLPGDVYVTDYSQKKTHPSRRGRRP